MPRPCAGREVRRTQSPATKWQVGLRKCELIERGELRTQSPWIPVIKGEPWRRPLAPCSSRRRLCTPRTRKLLRRKFQPRKLPPRQFQRSLQRRLPQPLSCGPRNQLLQARHRQSRHRKFKRRPPRPPGRLQRLAPRRTRRRRPPHRARRHQHPFRRRLQADRRSAAICCRGNCPTPACSWTPTGWSKLS